MRNNSFLHAFFDLDNTLTASRSVMAPAHQQLFKRLCDSKNVVVVSGAQASQIKKQIPDTVGASFYILGQTGNQAFGKDGSEMWKETFTDEQTRAIYDLIETLKGTFDISVKDENDLVEHRGAQISYSPIGHNEDIEKKLAFDPGALKRLSILQEHQREMAHLKEVGINVVPGGTTCFDFFLAGKNKGFNVARLIERARWNKEECVYVGDALFPGGNDETVVGVIPTHAVKNPEETFTFISKMLE